MTKIIITLVFIGIIIACIAAYLVIFLFIKPSINCIECQVCEPCHVNIVGDDFVKVTNVVNSAIPYSVITSKIDECKTVCKNTDTCIGFSFEPLEQRCSFFDKIDQFKSSDKHDTFIKLQQSAQRDNIVWYNLDNYLASTENSLQTSNNANDCKEKCLSMPTCKAYTIIENPTANEFACNIHNDIDTRRVLEKTPRYNTFIKASKL